MTSFVVSTPSRAANPPDYSSPLSSPPPSSVTNRLLDFSPQSSPPVPPNPPSPLTLVPATPSACLASSPPCPPSPSPSLPRRKAEPGDEQPESATPDQQKGLDQDATRPSAVTPPAVTTTRSGRRVVRKRPADDSPAAADRTPTKASPSAAAASKRVKREAARWQPAFVLSSKRSPLTNFDIRALLCKPEAWTVLSADEQAAVLALFPSTETPPPPPPPPADNAPDSATDGATDSTADGAPLPPAIAALANDDNFRHDCARFRSDLAAGFFDKAWLADAFAAHAQRARGGFDAYVVEAFEANWGLPLPDAYRPDGARGLEEPERAGSAAASVSGADEQDGDKDSQRSEEGSTEAAKAETERADVSVNEAVAPPDTPVKEDEEATQAAPEEPDAAGAEAPQTETGPLAGPEDAESTPGRTADDAAGDDATATKPPTRRRAAAKAAAPARTERPPRRTSRSAPAAKPVKRTQGRTAKRQKPPPEEDKAAAAFDWDFPDDDGDEVAAQKATAVVATPPVLLNDPLPASPEPETRQAEGTVAGTDTEDTGSGTDADADADWKPARKPARRGPRATAKRRTSSTMAVRGHKKRPTPSPTDGGGDAC